MDKPAGRKECGNYLFGTLRETSVVHPGTRTPCNNLHRNKTAVVSRSVLALDIDYPSAGFLDAVDLLIPGRYIVHPTYSSTQDEPRYRLLVPLDRDVAPDEYHHAAEALMNALGSENFDGGSSEPERYMFKPATPTPQMWWYKATDGQDTNADALLSDFEVDLSGRVGPRPHRNKRDPYAIEGTVGAFNRAYDNWDLLIREYELPYQSAGVERWGLVGASAAAGMGPVSEGLVFSHHANDPAHGVTCSAFDLVRLHRYGYLDEEVKTTTPVNRRPSHEAMLELASQDARVVAELVGRDFADSMDDVADAITSDSWFLGLDRNRKSGAVKDTIGNWDLITANDDVFTSLYFNELTMAIESRNDLPWRKLEDRTTFDAGDRAELVMHFEREYGFRPSKQYLEDVTFAIAQRDRVNPVRDWLESLQWDGVERLEESLPGVTPTPYTRLVARKSLVAAVARMFEPGCKWDHMLVLYGSEGLGKSYWIDKMSQGYTAELGRIDSKDTLMTLQRSWIMTSDESHTLRKADFEAQKEFLTRRSDVFRMPYAREVESHPRHSVIWGTTNEEAFLQRQEGNRRFLIVRCEDRVDFDALTDEYIAQIWAEAVHLYRAGETLYMDEAQAEVTAAAREEFIEEDALQGQIEEYADTLVPNDWDQMSPEARQLWLINESDGMARGSEPITVLCSLQIWVEALGRRAGEHRRTDLLRINRTLRDLPGWKKVPGQRRIPGYGPQQVFVRVGSADDR